MQLLTFQSPTGLRLGVKTARGVLDVAAALDALGGDNRQILGSPQMVYAAGQAVLEPLRALVDQALANPTPGWLVDESALTLGPCVPTPGKIICIGLNYRRHAEETGSAIPKSPVIFSKFQNTIAAPGETIPYLKDAQQYDYEAELAVVIGRRAVDVSEADALSYVMGYCNANDVSERALQNRTSQWLLGKTLDKCLPIGPYLVTADEIPDPQSLTIQLWFNGEQRQNSNTSDMIFSVRQLISYLSHYMTLEPGDLISTGTPEGVILGMAEKHWMKSGDTMTVEVEKLGKLTNKLV